MFSAAKHALTLRRTRSQRHHRQSQSLLSQALTNVANEDRKAFRLLYSLTCNKLFAICLRICQDRSDAEDILAEVYLTVWRRAGTWDPARGSAIAWLAKIARNRAIDRRRALSTKITELVGDARDFVDESPDALSALLSTEINDQACRCLGKLAPHQQAAIQSAFFDGLTYSELASRDGVPLGTMKSWIRRGLATMKVDMMCGA